LCVVCNKNPETWKDLGWELLPGGSMNEAELKIIAMDNNDVRGCCSSLFLL